MPEKLIQLHPKLSPQDYYETNKEQLSMVPDGTGLQILFNIEGELYVVAGPRQGRVLSVIGGAIENQQLPFAIQLEEELNEETFGLLQLMSTENGYRLLLNDGNMHALSIQDQHTFLRETGKSAYVTFTAVCSTLTLEQLKNIAEALSPTANFWNKIGNDLFQHTQNAPKDDAAFAVYWDHLKDTRSSFIANLVNEYNQLMESSERLLIDPITVFNGQTIEHSLNELDSITDYSALMRMARHTVGRYSERSGYHVFRANELTRAAQPDCTDKNVKDINDQVVAVGIFNAEAVAAVIPALTISPSKISAAGVLQFGSFAPTAALMPVSDEIAINLPQYEPEKIVDFQYNHV